MLRCCFRLSAALAALPLVVEAVGKSRGVLFRVALSG